MWWPNYDHNPPGCHGKVKKQIWVADVTTKICRGRDLCIQAGGHAGLWPKKLAESFKKVITFEPEPDLFDCMRKNLADIPNIEMHSLALGRSEADVLMNPHPSAGSWSIALPPAGRVAVRQTTIDALNVPVCDAIILDIEGYEEEAIAGAEDTIRKFRPVLHLEVWGKKRPAIDAWMAAHRYTFHGQCESDSIYVPQ